MEVKNNDINIHPPFKIDMDDEDDNSLDLATFLDDDDAILGIDNIFGVDGDLNNYGNENSNVQKDVNNNNDNNNNNNGNSTITTDDNNNNNNNNIWDVDIENDEQTKIKKYSRNPY